MSQELLVGIFAKEENIIAATRATREAGYSIYDVFAPYAVHGLSEAMGLKPSRLTWVCLASALTGLLVAGFAQFWIGAVDWPLNVGGKPLNSLPAYLPVMFELMVLLGGLGVTAALFARTKLYPGKAAWVVDKKVTNSRFALAMTAESSWADREALEQLWGQFGLVELRTVPEISQ